MFSILHVGADHYRKDQGRAARLAVTVVSEAAWSWSLKSHPGDTWGTTEESGMTPQYFPKTVKVLEKEPFKEVRELWLG